MPRTNALDLAGKRFGRLVAVADSGLRNGSGHVLWVCECDCGGSALVLTSNLRSGNTQSCGCWQADRTAEATKGIPKSEWRRPRE